MITVRLIGTGNVSAGYLIATPINPWVVWDGQPTRALTKRFRVINGQVFELDGVTPGEVVPSYKPEGTAGPVIFPNGSYYAVEVLERGRTALKGYWRVPYVEAPDGYVWYEMTSDPGVPVYTDAQYPEDPFKVYASYAAMTADVSLLPGALVFVEDEETYYGVTSYGFVPMSGTPITVSRNPKQIDISTTTHVSVLFSGVGVSNNAAQDDTVLSNGATASATGFVTSPNAAQSGGAAGQHEEPLFAGNATSVVSAQSDAGSSYYTSGALFLTSVVSDNPSTQDISASTFADEGVLPGDGIWISGSYAVAEPATTDAEVRQAISGSYQVSAPAAVGGTTGTAASNNASQTSASTATLGEASFMSSGASNNTAQTGGATGTYEDGVQPGDGLFVTGSFGVSAPAGSEGPEVWQALQGSYAVPAPAATPFASFEGVFVSAQTKASGLSVAASPTQTIPAGRILITATASDNAGTTTASSTEQTMSDSNGSTWFRLAEYRSGGGASNAGVTAGLFTPLIAADLETSDTLTLTLSSVRAAKVFRSAVFELGPGLAATAAVPAAAGGTGTTPSVSTSSLSAANRILIAAVAIEGPNTDSVTHPAGWTPLTTFGTSGDAADTNVTVHWAYRIVEGVSGVQTYNPTLGTSRDWVCTIAAITIA